MRRNRATPVFLLVLVVSAVSASGQQPCSARFSPASAFRTPTGALKGVAGARLTITPDLASVPAEAVGCVYKIDNAALAEKGIRFLPEEKDCRREGTGIQGADLSLFLEANAQSTDVDVQAYPFFADGNKGDVVTFEKAFRVELAPPAPKLPELSFTIPEAIDVTAGQEFDVPLTLQAEGFQGSLNVQAYPPKGVSIDQPKFTISAGEEKRIHIKVAMDAPEKGTMEVQAQTAVGGQLIMKIFRVAVRVAAAAPPPPAPEPPPAVATGPVIGAGGDLRFALDSTSVVLPPEGGRQSVRLTLSSVAGSHGTVTLDVTQTNGALSVEAVGCNGTPAGCVHDRQVEVPADGEVTLDFVVVATSQVEELARQMNGARSLLFLARAPGIERRATFIVELREAPPAAASKAAFKLSVDPPSLDLEAGGEAKTFEVRLEPEDGFREGVSLAIDGYNVYSPIELRNVDSVFQAGEYSPRKITAQAKPGAKPGKVTLTFRGGTTYQSGTMPSVELPISIRDAATATLTVDAGDAALFYPVWKDVRIRVDGKGFAGPLVLRASDSGSFEVVPARTEVAVLPATVDVRLKLKRSGSGNAAIEWSLDDANGRSLATKRVAFTALDGARGVAFTAPTEFSISPGEEKSIAVGLRAGTFKGPVQLVVNTSSALEVVGEPTIGTAPISESPTVTVRVKAKPNATIGEGGHSIHLKAGADFGTDSVSMGRHDIAVRIVSPPQPDFTIATTQPMLIVAGDHPGQITVRVTGRNAWSGPVTIAVVEKPDWSSVQPETAEVVSLPAEVTFEVSRAQDTGRTSAVVFRGTAGSVVQTARMPVELSVGRTAGGVRGAPPRGGKPGDGFEGNRGDGGDSDAGGGGLSSGAVPAELALVGQEVRTANAQLDGLAAVLEGNPELASDEAFQEQIGFIRLYEATLEKVQNRVGRLDERGVGSSEAILAVLLQSPAAVAPYRKMASLGLGQGLLFQMRPVDGVLETVGDMKKRMDWAGSSSAEILVQELRMRNLAEVAQPGLERMVELSDKLNKLIEKLPEGATQVEQAKQLFKSYTLATSLIASANYAAKAVLAYYPYDITRFYVTSNGQTRDHKQLNDAIPIKLEVETPVQVFMELRSKGGGLGMSPQQVVDWLWSRIPADKKEKWFPAAEKDSTKAKIQKSVKDFLNAVWSEVSKAPRVKAWVDWYGSEYVASAHTFAPIDINNPRIMHMESNSVALLRVDRKREAGERVERYVFHGIHATDPGKTAGYLFSMHEAYQKELQEAASRNSVRLWNLAGWVTVQGATGDCDPQPTPLNYGHGCGNNPFRVSPKKGISEGFPGLIDCNGRCNLPWG